MVLRVFKEQLCLSQMVHNFKIGGNKKLIHHINQNLINFR